MLLRLTLLVWLVAVSCGKAQPMRDPTADANELLDAMIGFSAQMLREHGEFYPYGAAMLPDGEITAVGAYDGDETPASQDVIDFLVEGFQAAAKSREYVATALFFDARVNLPDGGGESDAVVVNIDHVNDFSVILVIPYSLGNDTLTLGEEVTYEGDHTIFPRD